MGIGDCRDVCLDHTSAEIDIGRDLISDIWIVVLEERGVTCSRLDGYESVGLPADAGTGIALGVAEFDLQFTVVVLRGRDVEGGT